VNVVRVLLSPVYSVVWVIYIGRQCSRWRNCLAKPHVPPPNPANFSWLEIDETRDILVSNSGTPLISVTLRKIEGGKVALQITLNPGAFHQGKHPGLT
jgi:hypothetical protein